MPFTQILVRPSIWAHRGSRHAPAEQWSDQCALPQDSLKGGSPRIEFAGLVFSRADLELQGGCRNLRGPLNRESFVCWDKPTTNPAFH